MGLDRGIQLGREFRRIAAGKCCKRSRQDGDCSRYETPAPPRELRKRIADGKKQFIAGSLGRFDLRFDSRSIAMAKKKESAAEWEKEIKRRARTAREFEDDGMWSLQRCQIRFFKLRRNRINFPVFHSDISSAKKSNQI